MTRVKLASWYDGHAPGDVVDVPDELVGPLRRDGRIASVLPAPEEPQPPSARVERQEDAEPARRRGKSAP